jgi:ribosome-binding factor A
MSKNRIDKVNTEIQRHLSEILMSLKDPRIKGIISITGVDTSPDLKHAAVSVSIFNTDEESAKETMEILKKSAGHIRSELSRMMRIRTVPQINFTADESMAYSQKISRILEEIKHGK